MQESRDISPAIFGIWSGSAQLAEDLKAKADTVSRWLKRRRIPVHFWPAMIAAAAQRGKLLTSDQLLAFNTPPPRQGRRSTRTRRKRTELRAV
jgi:hypothetical protein